MRRPTAGSPSPSNGAASTAAWRRSVFYRKGGRRIAYAIVGGAGLPRPDGAQGTVVGGVEYQTLRLNDRLAVTWRRGGHTCVLIGQAGGAELLTLASWPLSPSR
jgi:hypothetical protein